MKKILQDMHVQIYESTPALSIQDNKVITSQATIQATNIVVCADHFTPQLIPDMKYKIYHAQTFIMLSEVLSSEQIRAIFPEKHFMAWDTDLIYHYFRLTPDNRFMIGGASLLYTYANHEKHHSHYIMHTLMQYFYKNFPQTTSIKFEYIWPGLIGISKDLFPLAGFDEHMPSVYYATAAAGLPLAAALGNYSAQHILHKKNELGAYLSPYRHFTLGKTVQKMLGTKLTFALNNFLKVSSL
jgi:gamma-glutamylputrescine oxidase